MQFPKSFAEMLTITHTHLFSMAAIFVFSGVALALCERPAERWRRLLDGRAVRRPAGLVLRHVADALRGSRASAGC